MIIICGKPVLYLEKEVLISKFSLGTAQFGMNYGVSNTTGQLAKSEAAAILLQAKNSGVKSLDTAVAYGDAELNLGEIGVSEFNLTTKLPGIPINHPKIGEWISNQINGALSRLRVSQLYGVLVHHSQQLLGKQGEEIFLSLEQIKKSGVVKKIGVSIYSPNELELLTKKYVLDIVQAPINILDNRLERDGWLHKLNKLGIEVQARSIFLQGLLLMNKRKIPSKFKPWESTLNQWHKWLEQNPEINATQACLSYVCSKANIDKFVVGIDNLNQFNELVDIIENPVNLSFPNIILNDEKFLHPSNWNLL